MKKKVINNVKAFYSFKNYSPTKNAVPVIYKGTKYLSKAQCMALEGITRKELDAYLKGEVNDPAPEPGIMALEDSMSEQVDPINDLGVFDDDAF